MMVLVDTCVWIDHLRSGNDHLARLLDEGRVMTHPFILGELACGNLRNRAEIMQLLGSLPGSTIAAHGEVLSFVDKAQLFGRGLGWVDVSLLAAARLSSEPIWTLDRAVGREAERLGIGF